MKQGIADGTITAERLDDAVHRILGLKAMRGLHQLTFPDKVKLSVVGRSIHREDAIRAARESITLLKQGNS